MGNSCCPSSSYWGSYCIWSLFLSRVWVWRSRRQNFTQTFTLSAPLGNGPWCFSRDYISESLDWSAMSVYFLGWSKYFCHSFVIADDCLGSFLRNNTLSVSFGHESSLALSIADQPLLKLSRGKDPLTYAIAFWKSKTPFEKWSAIKFWNQRLAGKSKWNTKTKKCFSF